jgi:hemolysin D
MNVHAPPDRRLPHRDDREFLPAALEILESPPSPIAIGLAASICGLVTFALLVGYFGKIEIIASAQGKIRPIGQVKTVQSMENGKVTEIKVRDGDRVERGDVMVTLDSTEVRAELASSVGLLAAAKAEIARRTAVDDVVSRRADDRYGVPVLGPLPSVSSELAAREQRNASGELAALNAKIDNVKAQVGEKRADLRRIHGSVAAQRNLIETLNERVSMKAALLERSSGSRASVIDATETMQQQEATLAAQVGQIGSTEAAIASAESEIIQSIEEFRVDNLRKLAEREGQADQLVHKVAELAAKLGNYTLISPATGVVQGVTVTTVGQVLTLSQEVARVVPDSSELEIEAYLVNKDIGFVEMGQEAAVKIETLPFSRYGTVPALVTHVARDAIPEPDAQARESGAPRVSRSIAVAAGEQRVQNLVYPVTLRLDSTTVNADGRRVRLLPGMTVTAEIKTGYRTVLEYVFSPLVEITSSALHER